MHLEREHLGGERDGGHMKITKAEIENTRAGLCANPACREQAERRNTWGECIPCHNASYDKREMERKSKIAANKATGHKYWQARGINVGERVVACLSNVFAPAGEIAYGIAKVGVFGAYVRCMNKKCIPQIWDKIK